MGFAAHKPMVAREAEKPMAQSHHSPEENLHASVKAFTGQQRLFMDLVKRGEQVRKKRMKAKLSLESVARMAGLSMGKASEIERGIAVPNEQYVLDYEKALKIEAKRVLIAAAEILADEEIS